jgi:hypothetical protein
MMLRWVLIGRKLLESAGLRCLDAKTCYRGASWRPNISTSPLEQCAVDAIYKGFWEPWRPRMAV